MLDWPVDAVESSRVRGTFATATVIFIIGSTALGCNRRIEHGVWAFSYYLECRMGR
jgi:hypothetical protein